MSEKIPTFECVPEGGESWKFLCPYCKDLKGKPQWHIHGAEAGHRAAHCFSTDSPVKNTGYYIVLKKEYYAIDEIRKIATGMAQPIINPNSDINEYRREITNDLNKILNICSKIWFGKYKVK